MGPPPSALPLAGEGGRTAPLAAPRGAPLTWAAGGGAGSLAALGGRSRVRSAGRWGSVDDLAGACIFLASAASDFVNGQIIYVDGGLTSVL